MFEWSDRFRLGEPGIDAEHERLFAVAERLHGAMSKGEGSLEVRNTLAELIAYTREHFRHEEELMRSVAYPDLPEHMKWHEELTQKVLEHQRAAETGRLAPTVPLLKFLKEWLAHHICERDRAVASYVAKRRA